MTDSVHVPLIDLLGKAAMSRRNFLGAGAQRTQDLARGARPMTSQQPAWRGTDGSN